MTSTVGRGPIREQRELEAALEALAASDADVRRGLHRLGYPVSRARPEGFATLLRIITAQQLSTKAAAAIWQRLEALMPEGVEAAAFARLSEESLRTAGLSARKAAYGRALADAILEGELDLRAMAAMEEEAAIKAITRLPGLGRWSAEIYLLFALGRADIMPADDLALQIGFQRLKGLDERPNGRRLRALTAAWSPHRGAGAIFLWHYYGAATLDDAGR